MCFGGGSSPAPEPPPPPPPPPAPTPPTPSASALPDTQAYTEANRRKKMGKSVRGALRIDLGTGAGMTKTSGTGVNTNN